MLSREPPPKSLLHSHIFFESRLLSPLVRGSAILAKKEIYLIVSHIWQVKLYKPTFADLIYSLRKLTHP